MLPVSSCDVLLVVLTAHALHREQLPQGVRGPWVRARLPRHWGLGGGGDDHPMEGLQGTWLPILSPCAGSCGVPCARPERHRPWWGFCSPFSLLCIHTRQVVDGLYLGGMEDAVDVESIVQHNVIAVLNVSGELCRPAPLSMFTPLAFGGGGNLLRSRLSLSVTRSLALCFARV